MPKWPLTYFPCPLRSRRPFLLSALPSRLSPPASPLPRPSAFRDANPLPCCGQSGVQLCVCARAAASRRLYTIEWDVPYRMYYQTTICVAEMFGAPTRSQTTAAPAKLRRSGHVNASKVPKRLSSAHRVSNSSRADMPHPDRATPHPFAALRLARPPRCVF
eukprot:6192909-Pleurochrysis_carterae.AAC.1